MTTLRLRGHNRNPVLTLNVPGSKSESNRALIIRHLTGKDFPIYNLSTADDTATLEYALKTMPPAIDVGPAGTAMRFLTALLARGKQKHILTGSQRMQERPVKILVDALRTLGADITYLAREGYPPLSIRGRPIMGGVIMLDGSVSSQYITALALIAPALPEGLTIRFTGEITSRPYVDMTLKIMEQFGASFIWSGKELYISPGQYIPREFTVEGDWSGASYIYEVAAFSETADILIPNLKKDSLQGDAAISKLFAALGVSTRFTTEGARLRKYKRILLPSSIELDCSDFPDLAQTLAVTFAGLGIDARLTGLSSLRIKETDRLAALIAELKKFGLEPFEEPGDTLVIPSRQLTAPGSPVETYEDHRMAMAFAPLAMITGTVSIKNPDAVNKSFPAFWSEMTQNDLLKPE